MNTESSIRIIVADDHALFREGLIGLLSENKHIYVVGEAENGRDLIEKYFELKPDVIVVDISMPQISGIDAVRRIKQREKSVKALFLSMHDGKDYIYYCLEAGGLGLINKNVMIGELTYAIKRVNSGQKYFGVNWTEERLENLVKSYRPIENRKFDEIDKLFSLQEMKVIESIGEGKTSFEIADEMNLSKRTVDTYRSRVMQKLNLKNLPELIVFAIRYKMNKK